MGSKYIEMLTSDGFDLTVYWDAPYGSTTAYMWWEVHTNTYGRTFDLALGPGYSTRYNSGTTIPLGTYRLYVYRNGSYRTDSGDFTIAADPPPTRTVWYSANGRGTAPDSQTVQSGSSLTLRSKIANQSGTSYTVSYNANGGSTTPSSSTSTYTYQQTYWNTNSSGTGTNYTPGGSYTINSDLDLYAVWSGSRAAVTLASAISKANGTASRKVTFDANGGTCSTASLDSTATVTYAFNKWAAGSASGTQYSAGTSFTPSGNTTMYATWTPTTGSYGAVTLPTATRTGYTFKGWATSSSATSGTAAGSSYTPTGDVTLYATWQLNSWTVSYNANGHGTAPASQTKKYGTNLTLQSFIAQQTGTGYTVSFNANNGTSTPDSLTSTLTYDQTYWNTKADGSGTNYTSGGTYSTNAAATLYAIWKTTSGSVTLPSAISRNNSEEAGFKVTFNANGGSCATTELTAVNTRKYTFSKWAAGSTTGTTYSAGASYAPTAATTMYATWTESVTNGSITLPTPTRTGHTFKGWATSSSATSGTAAGASYTPTAETTLYATWQINTWTVSYNTNGHGTTPAAQTKTYGQTLTLQPFISQQTATGHTVSFNKNGGTTTPSSITSNIYYNQSSWNTASNGSGDSYSSQGSYTANTGATLYAIWNSSNGSITLPAAITRSDSTETGFKVSFNANGGTCSTSELSATNTRKYTFKQWAAGSTSGTGYNAGTSFTPTGATTMYATWTESVTNGSITLPVPTRNGYTFMGWATSASASGGVTDTYTPSSNVTLYATWAMNNSLVHYNNNGTDTLCSVYYNNNGTAVLCNVYYNDNGTTVRI